MGLIVKATFDQGKLSHHPDSGVVIMVDFNLVQTRYLFREMPRLV